MAGGRRLAVELRVGMWFALVSRVGSRGGGSPRSREALGQKMSVLFFKIGLFRSPGVALDRAYYTHPYTRGTLRLVPPTRVPQAPYNWGRSASVRPSNASRTPALDRQSKSQVYLKKGFAWIPGAPSVGTTRAYYTHPYTRGTLRLVPPTRVPQAPYNWGRSAPVRPSNASRTPALGPAP